MSTRVLAIALLLVTAATLAGCGSASHHRQTTSASGSGVNSVRAVRHPRRPAVIALGSARALGALPEARSGIAAARFGAGIVVSGGLSAAGESTSTIFRLSATGASAATATLPGPVHDAAATTIAGRLLLFGGGQFEGSNRIVSVLPGRPRVIGTLPQALSDLDAVTIDGRAYVVGGWDGTRTNSEIYAITAAGSASTVGRLALGVRYPAAAALAGRLIVAGGETTSGAPTPQAWSFDPATGGLVRLPDLPAATDHAAAAALGARVYVLGGLRRGAFTDAILSWSPGERRWRASGRLPSAIADLGAVSFDGGIATIGGRDSAGKLAAVRLLRPVPPRG